MIGQIISHYRILEKLGAGGMGVVYKAQDTRLDRAVALKFLPENLLHQPQALERFRREAHAASALNHPNICTIYDIGEEDGRPFLAMEFIEGETLRQHIQGKPLDLEHLLNLGLQIGDALDAAHAQGIIHRDIKPANIFVTKRGEAKVLDFGLAKLLPKGLVGAEAVDSSHGAFDESVSVVGIISGTPSYMSPEQVRGDDLDTRADLFSLGLLLYEMATGRQAFSGNTGGVIIEAILTRAPTPVSSLNPEVPADLERIINRSIEKDKNLRYQTAAEIRTDLQQLKSGIALGQATATLAGATPRVRRRSWMVLAGVALPVFVLVIAGWLYNTRRANALNESDTIVLAGFSNKTNDPVFDVFDEALRQGLAVQLEQSPFLSLVSEQRIQQTLRLMGRSPDAKLSAESIRDLCQRVGSKAYLSGSISRLGSQYAIGINAVNCQTGDSLAQEQATADSKERVLAALGEAATKLRAKLGESLKTVQKLDTPIEQATTPSLEALQAYSLGRKTMLAQGDYAAAVPLFQHAIRLDPNFAMAYASIGTSYHNLGEKSLSAENTKKAYELRMHVSEREKFYIESHYHHFVTGDLEKARQVYDLWAQTYPRESVPPTNLGVIYQGLGQYEKALAEFREALRLVPGDALAYGDIVLSYINLNRLREARAMAEEAQAKKLDSPDLHLFGYELGFLEDDASRMARELAWAMGKPGEESILLYFEADTAAYSGRLKKAREFSGQAVASAERAQEKERAAGCEVAAALWEALFGNAAEARKRAASALTLSNGRDAQFIAALAVALIQDSARAQELADDLKSRFPEDTIVQFNYLPAIRAQLALNRNDAASAIETLHAASLYELGLAGSSNFSSYLYPVYVRGEAYLAAHQGKEAEAEFQKILNHRGVVVNEPIGALAHLGLAHAYVLQGDISKAKVAYRDFLVLWKDADPDISVLKQAKAEYATLQ